jgi:hypothetical protein
MDQTALLYFRERLYSWNVHQNLQKKFILTFRIISEEENVDYSELLCFNLLNKRYYNREMGKKGFEKYP